MTKYLLVILVFVIQSLWAQKRETPYVLLISFDGFRYDYVSQYDLPNFKAFISNGASADLIPSFPSKTFPNHYTLVTGLYPGHHGLVDNYFYDPTLKVKYSMRDPKMVVNPAFYGGTPLWQLAQQQGLKSASVFWVGSETPVQGMFPTYYLPFDDSYPDAKRIDQTMAWLQLPEKDRPHFVSLYFSLVDHAGHDFGPSSDELKRSVMKADSLVGDIMQNLKKLSFPVNVIIVSDHGMMSMKSGAETFVTLSKLFNTKDNSVIFSNGGTQVQLFTKRSDSLYSVLKKKEEHFKVYKHADVPVKWSYANDRCGDLLMVVEPGYYFQVNEKKSGESSTWYPSFGAHGFDPGVIKEMNGIFYASGPNIQSGIKLKPFENIHVYPFIAKILGLKTPPIDGNVKVLEKAYKK
jgi:predicted AlkP superfamily pyrophosphatase or phosphodiesterase